jgi:hypothetical protein
MIDPVFVGDMGVVLRALAEVRADEFYGLWVLLTRSWPEPLPEIEFWITRAGDVDVLVSLYVTGTRPDGADFNWGVSVRTRQDRLIVHGWVGRRPPTDDWSEMFDRSEETSDPQQAASLIRAIASEVCSQRQWLSPV